LTGKAADDAIDALKVVPATFPNVSLSMDVWPMPFKDSGCIVINLHLPFALKTSPFKA
jgi:hypothetical protein